MDKTIVSVSGFGYSGSSAVVDLLKEFSNVKVFPAEFDVLRLPGGVRDLEIALVQEKSVIRTDAAIRRFLDLAEVLARPRTKLHFGYDYEEKFNLRFRQATKTFINKLIDLKYNGSWYYHFHDLTFFSWLLRLFALKFKFKPFKNDVIYMSQPSHEKFIKCVKEYFDDLLGNLNEKLVVLDQSVDPSNPMDLLQYYPKFKLIVVDRDPRDVFIDGLAHSWIPTDDVDSFIRWFSFFRSAFTMNDRSQVLLVRFEDLCYDYENSLTKILGFLGINSESQTQKKQFFDPEKSKRNIGIWKNSPKQDFMGKIFSELKQFCCDV